MQGNPVRTITFWQNHETCTNSWKSALLDNCLRITSIIIIIIIITLEQQHWNQSSPHIPTRTLVVWWQWTDVPSRHGCQWYSYSWRGEMPSSSNWFMSHSTLQVIADCWDFRLCRVKPLSHFKFNGFMFALEITAKLCSTYFPHSYMDEC